LVILFDENHILAHRIKKSLLIKVTIHSAAIGLGTFLIVVIDDLLSRIALLVVVCGIAYITFDPHIRNFRVRKYLPCTPVLTENGLLVSRYNYRKGHPLVLSYNSIIVVRYTEEKRQNNRITGEIMCLYKFKGGIYSLFFRIGKEILNYKEFLRVMKEHGVVVEYVRNSAELFWGLPYSIISSEKNNKKKAC